MKKILSLVICVVVMATFTGCKDENGNYEYVNVLAKYIIHGKSVYMGL